jgi:hypothetical protein
MVNRVRLAEGKAQKMKYIINQESDIQTVFIEASGIINSEVAKEMVLAAGTELNRIGFQKCLIDLKNTNLDPKQTLPEMLMFVEVFKKARINKSAKIAAIIAFKDRYRLYLERTANFKGYKIKHFKNRDDALNWLCM